MHAHIVAYTHYLLPVLCVVSEKYTKRGDNLSHLGVHRFAANDQWRGMHRVLALVDSTSRFSKLLM